MHKNEKGLKQCVKCKFANDSCKDCIDNNTCRKCEDGYTLREFRSEAEEDLINIGCLKCPTEDGCLTCANNVCTSC